jgi:hypothetical protein
VSLRAWPVVERVLLVAAGLVVVAVLAFLVAWHVRWRGMLAMAPGAEAVVVPAPLPLPLDEDEWLPQGPRWEEREDFVEWDLLTTVDQLGNAGAGLERSIAARDALARRLGIGSAGGGPRAVAATGGDAAAGGTARGADAAELAKESWWWIWDVLDRRRAAGGLAGCDAAVAAQGTPVDRAGLARWVEVTSNRDDAYVLATLVGTAPPAALARWRAEPPADPVAVVADGIAGARRVRCARYAALFAAGPRACAVARGLPGLTWREAPTWVRLWWAAPEECAEEDAETARIEAAVRGRVMGVPGCWAWPGQGGATPEVGALHLVMRQRLARLAVAVLAQRDAQGNFPASVPGLDLVGGKDRVALALHLEPRKFSIAADPAVAVPAYIAAGLGKDDDDDREGLRLDARGVAIDLDGAGVWRLLVMDGLRALPGEAGTTATGATAAAVAPGGAASGAGVAP